MQEGPSAVSTMQEGPSAVSTARCDVGGTQRRRCNVGGTQRRRCSVGGTQRRRCDVGGTQRCRCDVERTQRRRCNVGGTQRRRCSVGGTQSRQCDVGGTQRRRRGPAPSARCRIKELNDVWTMQERPVGALRCHDDGRATVVTTTARENKCPGRWWDSRLRRGFSRKDVLTLSPILTGRSLRFRYYCWFFTSRATPNVMLLISMKSKTVFQTDTLYSCLLSLLSLVSLSLSGLSHTLLS